MRIASGFVCVLAMVLSLGCSEAYLGVSTAWMAHDALTKERNYQDQKGTEVVTVVEEKDEDGNVIKSYETKTERRDK